jgi:hypothetical protein
MHSLSLSSSNKIRFCEALFWIEKDLIRDVRHFFVRLPQDKDDGTYTVIVCRTVCNAQLDRFSLARNSSSLRAWMLMSKATLARQNGVLLDVVSFATKVDNSFNVASQSWSARSLWRHNSASTRARALALRRQLFSVLFIDDRNFVRVVISAQSDATWASAWVAYCVKL